MIIEGEKEHQQQFYGTVGARSLRMMMANIRYWISTENK